MDGTKNRKRRLLRRVSTLGAWSIVAAAGVLLAGCHDPRISLDEFIQMQQARARASATEAAAEVPDAAMLDRALGPHQLGPGDVVRVDVTAGEAAAMTSTEVRVRSDGTVNLPLAEGVKVDAMTLEQAEAAIQQAYVPKYHTKAVVRVDVVQPMMTDVLVLGAVESPGLVSLRRNERNLLLAVNRAGGASGSASGEVTLERIRQPGESVTINLRRPEEIRAAMAMKPLARGDIVRVEAAPPNMIFVYGLVNAPHPQEYPPSTRVTILQAIAGATGLREDVFPDEGTLIRRVDDRDVHVKLNLKRLYEAKDENIYLVSGDILWVNNTFKTRLLDFINRTIYLRAGATASATYTATGSQRYGDDKGAEADTVTILP